jgi:hypothetical protein
MARIMRHGDKQQGDSISGLSGCDDGLAQCILLTIGQLVLYTFHVIHLELPVC